MWIASTEHQLRVEPNRPAVIGIFLAIDGCYVGWIFIEIRPPNSIFVAVRINPFPQDFACHQSLSTCFALYADEISSKSVTVTPTEASAMI